MKSYLREDERFDEVKDGIFQRGHMTISIKDGEFCLVFDELTIQTDDYEFDGTKLTTESAAVSLVFENPTTMS